MAVKMYKGINLDNFDEVKANLDNLNEWDWEEISKSYQLSEKFIEEFADKVDWFSIAIAP